MRVVALPRQGGKTTQMIRLAAAENLYIVCISRQEAMRVAREARRFGLNMPFPITWDDFARRLYFGKGINGFLFDNLDMLIQRMAAPVPVVAVSLTDDSQPPDHLPGAGARQLWSAWECHDCEETGPSESGNADAEASAHAVAEGHHAFASHVSGRHYFGANAAEA